MRLRCIESLTGSAAGEQGSVGWDDDAVCRSLFWVGPDAACLRCCQRLGFNLHSFLTTAPLHGSSIVQGQIWPRGLGLMGLQRTVRCISG